VTSPSFRISYGGGAALLDDVERQLSHGGLMIEVTDQSGLAFNVEVELELALPDGTAVRGIGKVLQAVPGIGVAIAIDDDLAAAARGAALAAPTGQPGARHERVDRAQASRASPAEKSFEALSHAEKIQKALHGTREERNAVLRDSNRSLHPFVLKNPQLDADDITAIAKNAQVAPEMLTLIAGRTEWLQRPAVAVALARNPRTPPDIAIRALEFVPIDALRSMAKGTGVLPHVAAAARKKVIDGK
jgi:hypothetical protein